MNQVNLELATSAIVPLTDTFCSRIKPYVEGVPSLSTRPEREDRMMTSKGAPILVLEGLAYYGHLGRIISQ